MKDRQKRIVNEISVFKSDIEGLEEQLTALQFNISALEADIEMLEMLVKSVP